MTRQQKYKDTDTFHYYNANPKGKFTGDCVIRAICTALQKPYEQVYRELLENCLKTGYSLASKENYQKYLELQGWKKCKQPRLEDNTKYTGNDFCVRLRLDGCVFTGNQDNSKSKIIAHIGGHHLIAIVDCKIWDTWDSSRGCIGNYWMKG